MSKVKNMVIIYDNIIFNLQRQGGITTYWRNITSFKLTGFKIEFSDSMIKFKIPLALRRYLDFKYKLDEKFIFHSSYYRICSSPLAINVTTVHDFTYEYYRKGLKKWIHSYQKKRALKKSSLIICVSENTKKDLLKLYPEISSKKVEVVYLGVGKEFIRLQGVKKQKTILYVGNRHGYKNFKVLCDFLLKDKTYNLTLVGGEKLSKTELNSLINLSYKHFTNISNDKLNVLYNQSYALIYTSHYEGFGLPIIEAMKAGCPVICNNTSSLKEIGSKYVIQGPMSEEFIEDALNKLKNKKFKEMLINAGLEYANDFTWEKTASKTHELYKRFQ